MPDNARLVEIGVMLRAGQPQLWEEFTRAMREYAAGSALDMIRCAPDMLPRAQGMAMMANEIASVLNDAPKIHDKLRGR